MTEEARLRRRAKIINLLSTTGYPTALCLVLLVLWQILVPAFNVKPAILPVPSDIVSAGWENRSLILEHTWPTLIETVAGFVIAAVLGIIVAVAITSVPAIHKTIYPLLVGSLVVPKIAVAPLFVIWFGFGYTSKIIMVVLIAFFPVVVDMALGLTSIPLELRMLNRSMGASRWRAFWKISFPFALPNLFVGLKLAMALAIIGAIVAEFVQSSQGLGYLLLQANSTLQTSLFFATIVALTVLGVALYMVIEVLESIILRTRKR
ncbi:ABC transporter permease [Streptosporangium sp. NBC_01755]|uniref:ABC transporter permease n=1 Tax=unclassified Streptosporangium TaxID=2632669 RepID=UPI002DDA5E7A|nr:MULTISPECIES: ABC transporter permease [unclassified Streptosporangium]WSA28240.1 ABC transporter permease [Streptosporangium sp. NBC_01810]WSD00283.1 ABC transporter permease [Streptosporangium sp. NBC_01755]